MPAGSAPKVPPGAPEHWPRDSFAQGSASDRSAASGGRRAHAHERETTLLLEARSGSADARATLVRSFTPLIGSVARNYRRVPGVDRSELMQEGVVGVLRALERFNPDLGRPFWAYASWWVRQAMQQLVAELSRPVVLSDRALRRLAHVRDARRRFVSGHAREPSWQELATQSELTMVQLQELVVAERQARSLEEPVDETTSGGATFGDLLRDPCAEEAYDELATRMNAEGVPQLLTRLGGRERGVIAARYGLGGPERTLRELGQTMGVSAERVRQIEQSALEKMRMTPGGVPPRVPQRVRRRPTRGHGGTRRTPLASVQGH